jgi:hypothetical protein
LWGECLDTNLVGHVNLGFVTVAALLNFLVID